MFSKFKEVCYDVVSGAIGEPNLSYKLIVSAGDRAIHALKVHSITRSYNIEQDIGVTTFISAMVTANSLRYVLSVNSGAVKVKLTTFSNGKPIESVILFGVAQMTQDPNMVNQSISQQNADELSVSMVTFELYPEPIWLNRLKTLGLNFHQCSGLNAVKYILGSLTDSVQASTAATSIDYEEEDQKFYHSVSVPDNTPFLGVFDYIQNHYGIYSHGLGVCYHRNTWHIFKPYDENKYNTDKYRLCIYNLPAEQGRGFNKTLKPEGKTYHLVSTGETKHLDLRNIEALNEGTGYRVASVRSLDLRTNSVANNKTNVTTPDNFVSSSNPNPHKTGLTNAPMIRERFKDDDKVIMSEYQRKRGQYVKLSWERSVFGVITPGMPVKLLYPTEKAIITRYGTVIGELHQTQLDGGSMATDRYVSASELLVWVI